MKLLQIIGKIIFLLWQIIVVVCALWLMWYMYQWYRVFDKVDDLCGTTFVCSERVQ